MNSFIFSNYLTLKINDCLISYLGGREELLVKALEAAPPRTYLDALGALLKWISDMEDILNTENIRLDGMESLEKQFQQYKVNIIHIIKI